MNKNNPIKIAKEIIKKDSNILRNIPDYEECPNCETKYPINKVPHNCTRCGLCLKCPE